MEKIVNENGELVLKRLPWMQEIMTSTYNRMIIVALIETKSINGAWEYAITERLKSLWKNPVNRCMILELLEETGAEGLNAQFDKAGYLITKSKNPDHELF
jgi:hypothetical protein